MCLYVCVCVCCCFRLTQSFCLLLCVYVGVGRGVRVWASSAPPENVNEKTEIIFTTMETERSPKGKLKFLSANNPGEKGGG